MSLDISLVEVKEVDVFSTNITHNLARMADAVGLYKLLWHPDENGVVMAKQLIEPIETALYQLIQHPAIYKSLESSNGWGTCEDFISWLWELVEACIEHPFAKVIADR